MIGTEHFEAKKQSDGAGGSNPTETVMTGNEYAKHIRSNLKAKRPGRADIRAIMLLALIVAMGVGAVGFQIYGMLQRHYPVEEVGYDRLDTELMNTLAKHVTK